jgi:GNAT superfamily N-acetyltransferase
VGWLLAHRTSPSSVRYSSLFVAPAHRGRARALALLNEAFRRQHAAAIPTARAAIDRRNTAMIRLLKRHLGAYLLAIGRSQLSLAPPLPPPQPSPDP